MSENEDVKKAEEVLKEFPLEGNRDAITVCPRCGDELTILQVSQAIHMGYQRPIDIGGPTAVKVTDTSGDVHIAVRVYVTCESCGYPAEEVE